MIGDSDDLGTKHGLEGQDRRKDGNSFDEIEQRVSCR